MELVLLILGDPNLKENEVLEDLIVFIVFFMIYSMCAQKSMAV